MQSHLARDFRHVVCTSRGDYAEYQTNRGKDLGYSEDNEREERVDGSFEDRIEAAERFSQPFDETGVGYVPEDVLTLVKAGQAPRGLMERARSSPSQRRLCRA